MIIFKHIDKIISGHNILSNINLVIENGEFVSIVGKSGAGKSSLLKMLSGETLPSSGELIVENDSVPHMSKRALQRYRRSLGFVHQDFLLLPKKTIYENIAFAMEVCGYKNHVIKKRVFTTLDIVDLGGKEKRYPHELSGGEKQRVAIARALIHQPKLLIADEPTGNLDPENSREIFDLLLKINSLGTTVIVTTHDDTIVDHIKKRVIVIEKGQVVSDREEGKYKRGEKKTEV